MSDLATIFGNGFDTGSVPPAEDFVAIPPGKYPALVEKAEVKSTKAGNGHYVELTLSILDGQYKNRKLFDRINIDNPSQECVSIGLRSLAALGQAIGLTSISDTSQLLQKVCIAHVKVKDEQNYVRTYSSLNGDKPLIPNQPVQQPQPTQPAQTNQVPNAGVKPPWAR